MNEDEQVRYHGKASGLHLLGAGEREDGRNEGGIWYVTALLRCELLMLNTTQAIPEGQSLATLTSSGSYS